jgi:hypothetical protein
VAISLHGADNSADACTKTDASFHNGVKVMVGARFTLFVPQIAPPACFEGAPSSRLLKYSKFHILAVWKFALIMQEKNHE